MYLRLLSSSSTFSYRILENKDFLDNAEQEDPTMFVSEKTQRGPLDENWLEEYSAACLVASHPDHLKIGENLNSKRILTTDEDGDNVRS